MLQIGLGGYKNVATNDITYDDVPVYYEPGFNIMAPLEIAIPPCDQIYCLFRKRNDIYGDSFDILSKNNFNVSTIDITTGENVPSLISRNVKGWDYYHVGWNNSTAFTPLIVAITNSIEIETPVERTRILDCTLRDKTDNDFLNFRITVDDKNKAFYYLPVYMDEFSNRNTFTGTGQTGMVNIKTHSDIYILISPFAYLQETNEENSDFSYPLNSVFYHRQKTYNDEDFDFSIKSVSHSSLLDDIELISVPNYRKIACLLLDGHLYTDMLSINEETYIEVEAVGVLSEIIGTYKIYFVRS